MRLTRGEGWWLLRRRAGASQEEWAMRRGLSVDRLRAQELDRAPVELPGPLITERDVTLTPGELATIARRRAGYSIERVARWLDVSVTTAKRMERDRTRTAGRLARWWLASGLPRARAAAPVVVRGPSKTMCRSAEDRGGRRPAPRG